MMRYNNDMLIHLLGIVCWYWIDYLIHNKLTQNLPMQYCLEIYWRAFVNAVKPYHSETAVSTIIIVGSVDSVSGDGPTRPYNYVIHYKNSVQVGFSQCKFLNTLYSFNLNLVVWIPYRLKHVQGVVWWWSARVYLQDIVIQMLMKPLIFLFYCRVMWCVVAMTNLK